MSKLKILTAILEGVTSKTLGAEAYWISIIQFTLSIQATWVGIARILWWTAAHLGITIVARWALAYASMVNYITQSKCTTLTRRCALAIDARLTGIALGIGTTAQGLLAKNVCIAQISGQAATVDAVVDRHTLSVLSARILLARIYAASVKAVAQLI